jgi:hypothetical protein
MALFRQKHKGWGYPPPPPLTFREIWEGTKTAILLTAILSIFVAIFITGGLWVVVGCFVVVTLFARFVRPTAPLSVAEEAVEANRSRLRFFFMYLQGKDKE